MNYGRRARARVASGLTMFSSEGTACRTWQMAAHQSCERHRIEWLRQYTLGAKRDVVLDLAALHAGSQEQHQNGGGWRVLAQACQRCQSVHERHPDIQQDE